MARHAGPIRVALRTAARELLTTRQHATSRDLLARAVVAGVGLGAARVALKDMVRAGELRAVAHVRAPGSRRPLTAYTLATEPAAPELQLWAAMAQALTGHATARTGC